MKRTPLRRGKPLRAKRRTLLSNHQDALWTGIRLLACERAGEQCEKCHKPTPFNMGEGHHILKRSSHPELKYVLSNVLWLCHWCHQQAHEYEKPCPAKPETHEITDNL